MKDILVLTRRTEDYRTIASAVPAAFGRAVLAEDFVSAGQMHCRSPFDTVIADIELFRAADDDTNFIFSKHPFVSANPFVQFVVLCGSEHQPEAAAAVKEGAAGYLLCPVKKKDITLLLFSVDRELSRDLELDYLRGQFWKREWLDIIQSRNPAMKKLYRSIRSVAPTDATVLLLGETGTGKGMLARLVHWHSRCYEKPFISVHCGAIPETLMESELFGHEKGAFTGADRKKRGKFEMARGGTIFLDEIGTIPPSAQIKLLQVLQDGTFSRVGGESLLQADVRVIAATNADLEQAVKDGVFRKDLYYRLNIFPVRMPPLSKRMEDLEHLISIILRQLNTKYGKNISTVHPDVVDGFQKYDWPGNIRELENILERAYILEQTEQIREHHLPIEIRSGKGFHHGDASSPPTRLAAARNNAVLQFEKQYLTTLLIQCGGIIAKAAETAGITTRQLHRLMTRHGLDKKDFKS